MAGRDGNAAGASGERSFDILSCPIYLEPVAWLFGGRSVRAIPCKIFLFVTAFCAAAPCLAAQSVSGAGPFQPSIIPIPIGSAADWFPQSAYPAAARRAEQEGRVVFRLAIDPRGMVAGCTIVTSSGSEARDAGTCELARANAHFKPADERTVPATRDWVGAVRWKLEKSAPIPAISFSQVGRFEISGTGAPTSCVADATGPVPLAATGDPCTRFKPEALFKRLGALHGQPVRVTLQLALVMDGDPGFPEEQKVAGRTILMMSRAHIDIAPDGRVINCEILETETAAGAGPFELCLAPLGPYVPVSAVDAKPRSATILTSVTYEQRKP